MRFLALSLALVACGDYPTTEPEITVPTGALAAVPFQNRLDVPEGIFQVKLYNGTAELLDVVGVQLVWDGLTTPVADRANTLAAGDRLDYPVPLAAAHCAGDGTVADMPSLADAYVRVLLADGTERRAGVYDTKHFARTLYLQDCERQHIAAAVAIEWVDVHAAALDGRQVTDASLRLTRKSAADTITVPYLSNNILFTTQHADPVAVLPANEQQATVTVRFTEGRCDTHAMAETSQPFQFDILVDLGDGVQHPYAMPIPVPDQTAMRQRLEAGCAALGKTEVLGQGQVQGPLAGATTTTSG